MTGTPAGRGALPALTLTLSLSLLLAACGRSDDGPGTVSAGEQKALDEAAEMVEGQKLDPASLPSAGAGQAARAAPAPAPSPAKGGQSN